MNLVEHLVADIRIEILQRRCIAGDPAPAPMIVQVLRGGLSESALGPDPVYCGLADLLEPSREVPLRFIVVACSSALANAAILTDSLIDLPLDAAVFTDVFVESRHCSLSHCRPSSSWAGRPLHRQYSSAQASSSSLSNAIPGLPMVITRTQGRTSLLKTFLFMPR